MKDVLYLGIDQTGAINQKGVPKPLPACLIRDKQIEFIYLDSFNQPEIKKRTGLNHLGRLLICVDCVFGLPQEMNLSWREALIKIGNFEGYGRIPAQNYFRHLAQNRFYRRKIEILCNANSVFKEKPFQKNIQTGTYRIWKDLSLKPDDFYVPALEKRNHTNQLPLFEGYPSYSWKIMLGSKKREPQQLSSLVKNNSLTLEWTSEHQKQVIKDPNLADAFLLALTMKTFKKEALKQSPSQEGWILGAPTKL